VPGLAAGLGSSGSTTLTLPSPLPAGSYYIIARPMPTMPWPKARRRTTRRCAGSPSARNFIVSSMSVAFTIAAGSTVSVTDVVQNQGGDAAGASTTRFYLSANLSLDASDVLCPAAVPLRRLRPAPRSTGSTLVTIPAGTAAGTTTCWPSPTRRCRDGNPGDQQRRVAGHSGHGRAVGAAAHGLQSAPAFRIGVA